jgi:hypothetical protein
MILRVAIPFLLLLCAPALRADNAAVPEGSNFEKTHVRIDALFRGRDAPPILPGDIRNPFSPPGERPSSSGDTASGTDPTKRITLSDRELLERVAPAIQVRGIVETGGHPAIIIGKKPFDEGATLSLRYGETTLELKIKRINSDTFTLGYKEAELTLRLPR